MVEREAALDDVLPLAAERCIEVKPAGSVNRALQ
jgi:hypothetical protein